MDMQDENIDRNDIDNELETYLLLMCVLVVRILTAPARPRFATDDPIYPIHPSHV